MYKVVSRYLETKHRWKYVALYYIYDLLETGRQDGKKWGYTGWLKNHATYIKIVIDGCNSIKFGWIYKHNIAVTMQELTQVTSCCNQLAPVRQLSFNSRSARIYFLQMQRISIVEHCLASRSYLTCQNEFRDTFPDSRVPNKSTVSRLANRLRHYRNSSPGCIRHEEKSECMHRWTRWTFPTLDIKLFFLFPCTLFFYKWNVSGMGFVTFRSPCRKILYCSYTD
jgi:hypothetical protein